MHRQGEDAAAEALYQRILSEDPGHPEALHRIGVLALQAGRADRAIAYIGQAALAEPDHPAYHLDLGVALREHGHLEPARAAFSVASLLDDTDPAPRAAMADVLGRLGRPAEAATAWRAALTLAPSREDWQRGLGLALLAAGEPTEAAEVFRSALATRPETAETRHDLASALLAMGEPEAAERELRHLLSAAPRHARALNSLGLTLQDLVRPAEALAAFNAALDAAPDDPDIRNNLGVALRDLDQTDAALACFEAVIAAEPNHAPAHLNAASVLLLRGDYVHGWEEFEWRDRVPGASRRRFAQPRWEGEALAGRRLLVHAEMGLGDTIQFCRFVPRVTGGPVTLLVPHALTRLLPGSRASVEDVPFDLHCPLLSLPRLLGIRLGDVAQPGYLQAEPAAAQRWRTRLAGRPGPHIGLCWAGASAYAQDRARSLPPHQLAALAGFSLVSLQKGAPSLRHVQVADWTDELSDLADTAALIEALDVVVSVDTAVAHLAGALGTPVLLLDRFGGDWRWLRGRDDSPWYPSLRIVRQTAPGDWDDVMRRVAAALTPPVRRPP